MADRNDSKDRWRELADLLGLPPDAEQPEPERPAPRDPIPAPVAVQIEEPEQEPPVPARKHYEERAEPRDVERREREEALHDDLPDMEIITIHGEGDIEPIAEYQPRPITQAPEPSAAHEAEAPAAEDEPRRKRRRRGRRGRRGGPENGEDMPLAAPEETAEADIEEPALPDALARPNEEEDKNARPGRRRRGRKEEVRSHRDEEPEREELDDSAEEERDAEREAADDDDDSDTDFSDWNVPSWQELIGSLYRPDR
jgi:hypothetical protein